MFTRPRMLICASAPGSSTEWRTSICAACWFSTSKRPVATARRASADRTSALISSTPRGTFEALPRERSSSAVTSQPASRYASAMWDPMNPAPPATRTRPLMRSVSASHRSVVSDDVRPGRRPTQYRSDSGGGNRRRGSNPERTTPRREAGASWFPRISGESGRQLRDLPAFGAGLEIGGRDRDDPRGGRPLAHVHHLERGHHLRHDVLTRDLPGAPQLEDVARRHAVLAALVDEEHVLRLLERPRQLTAEEPRRDAVGNRDRPGRARVVEVLGRQHQLATADRPVDRNDGYHVLPGTNVQHPRETGGNH